MNLLESLAMGLRGAGGVISPQVYKEIAAEDQANNQLKKQLAVQEYQQKIKDEREQALGDSVRPFLESGNLEGAAAAAAAQPGGFQTGMTLLGQAEQRRGRAEALKTQLDQRAQDLQLRHEQRLEELAQRGADQAALAAATRAHQAQMAQFQREGQIAMARLTASLRPERQPQVVTNEQGVFQIGPNNQAIPVTGPDGKPLAGKARSADTKQVVNLARDLEKAGLPEIDSVLLTVEDGIKNNPRAAEYLSGVQSKLPDALVPADVRPVRQAFQKLFNITLKNRSGAAVTNQELERLKKEFAAGLWNTKEQIETGLNQARNIIQNHYASIASGYGGEVLDSYNKNVRDVGGRVVLDRKPSGGVPAGVAPEVWNAMTPEEKALWK